MKRPLMLVSLVCSIGVIFILYSNAHSQIVNKNYTVKLYSGGNTVGTWQSFQIIENGSETVSFYIGSQTFPRKVTVSGTYSVEQTQ